MCSVFIFIANFDCRRTVLFFCLISHFLSDVPYFSPRPPWLLRKPESGGNNTAARTLSAYRLASKWNCSEKKSQVYMVQAVPVQPNGLTLSFTGLWGVPWQKLVTLHILNIIKSLQVPFFVNPAFENMPALKQTEHIETVHILIPLARWHICRAEAPVLSVKFLKSVSWIKKGTLSPSMLFQKHSVLYLLTKRCFQERTKWPPVIFIIHLIINIDLIWNHLKYTLLDISEKVFPE